MQQQPATYLCRDIQRLNGVPLHIYIYKLIASGCGNVQSMVPVLVLIHCKSDCQTVLVIVTTPSPSLVLCCRSSLLHDSIEVNVEFNILKHR